MAQLHQEELHREGQFNRCVGGRGHSSQGLKLNSREE
uniref:Uncharacterized protein n=1 Tax=Trichinella nativa TaxID=6335 RepID=A0A0V1KJV8_9BILA